MQANGRQEAGTYETIAHERTWGRHVAMIERRLVDRAAAHYCTPGAMLDIGCESGRWALRFHRDGWRIWGTDIDDEMLDRARQRMPEAKLILVDRDRTDLPIPTDGIDLAVCMEVAPAINASWFPSEVARTLRPGARLTGTFWNRSSYRGLMAGARSGGRDWYAHDYRQWRSSMEAAGFIFEHEEGLYWSPFSRGSDSRFVGLATRIESALRLHRLVRWSPWVGFVARLDR